MGWFKKPATDAVARPGIDIDHCGGSWTLKRQELEGFAIYIDSFANLIATTPKDKKSWLAWKSQFESLRAGLWLSVGNKMGQAVVNAYKPLGLVPAPILPKKHKPWAYEREVYIQCAFAYMNRLRVLLERRGLR